MTAMRNQISARDDPTYIEVDHNKEIRCPNCGKLLMKGDFGHGTKVEVKCPRNTCKTLCRYWKI